MCRNIQKSQICDQKLENELNLVLTPFHTIEPDINTEIPKRKCQKNCPILENLMDQKRNVVQK